LQCQGIFSVEYVCARWEINFSLSFAENDFVGKVEMPLAISKWKVGRAFLDGENAGYGVQIPLEVGGTLSAQSLYTRPHIYILCFFGINRKGTNERYQNVFFHA
jgi:hypothetical protein